MKLNKKTIYKIETLDAFNNFIDDCIKQGFRHPDLSDLKQWNIWTSYDERTCVRINEHGCLNYCYEEYYTKEQCNEYKDYAFVIYDSKPRIKSYEYIVRVNGKKTTVMTSNGKVAEAVCHSDDEFDVVEGFRVAVEKLRIADHERTLNENNILTLLKNAGCESFWFDSVWIRGCDKNGDDILHLAKKDEDFKYWLTRNEKYDLSMF